MYVCVYIYGHLYASLLQEVADMPHARAHMLSHSHLVRYRSKASTTSFTTSHRHTRAHKRSLTPI